MNFKRFISAILAMVMIFSLFIVPVSADTTATEDTTPYLDTTLSFEERAADLISRMTLEEKVSQIGYAACDNGLVIVFTECVKCYQLKKVCNFDIKLMSIENGVMYVSDGENNAKINMSDIGGDSIAADEANLMLSNGAVLVDVRTTEEFAQGSADGSVNIPLDEIASLSDLYNNDQTIIFCCGSGTRAAKAVEEAKSLGFTNTYNGGSYTNY